MFHRHDCYRISCSVPCLRKLSVGFHSTCLGFGFLQKSERCSCVCYCSLCQPRHSPGTFSETEGWLCHYCKQSLLSLGPGPKLHRFLFVSRFFSFEFSHFFVDHIIPLYFLIIRNLFHAGHGFFILDLPTSRSSFSLFHIQGILLIFNHCRFPSFTLDLCRTEASDLCISIVQTLKTTSIKDASVLEHSESLCPGGAHMSRRTDQCAFVGGAAYCNQPQRNLYRQSWLRTRECKERTGV